MDVFVRSKGEVFCIRDSNEKEVREYLSSDGDTDFEFLTAEEFVDILAKQVNVHEQRKVDRRTNVFKHSKRYLRREKREKYVEW